jgi:hypothetical protein
MAIKAAPPPWPLMAICYPVVALLPSSLYKSTPRAPAVAPSLSRAPHPPPRPHTRHRHRGLPPVAATLHHWPSSRPSPSKVKISKCSPSYPLRFPLFTRPPRCPGRRQIGRPELHRRSPLFKIRLSPVLLAAGEHTPPLLSISSFRFASSRTPGSPDPHQFWPAMAVLFASHGGIFNYLPLLARVN